MTDAKRVQVIVRFLPEQLELIDKAAGHLPRQSWIVGTCLAAAKGEDVSPAAWNHTVEADEPADAKSAAPVGKAEKVKLNPTMQAYADGAPMPKGLYPSHDFTPKHLLRDERGWAFDGVDKDGKSTYVDPAKRMAEPKTS